MIYLKSFDLLSESEEESILNFDNRTYLLNGYPFRIFPKMELKRIEFAPITCFNGSNGSGKSTLLNIIGEKLNSTRNTAKIRSDRFLMYVEKCNFRETNDIAMEIKTITSDDVFDYMFNIRRINRASFNQRESLVREYIGMKDKNIRDFQDYQEMLKFIDSKKESLSKFVKKRMINKDILEQSNGESALLYFSSEITENGLYLLDEPENSMSPAMQLKLAKFIEESSRFFNCQFIIATHSPFILGLKDALIYDLDSYPVTTKKWEELENVKTYYNYFNDNKDKFK